jgi:hypothetical protein
MRGETSQPKARHIMTGKTSAQSFRYTLIGKRSWSQAIETKDLYRIAVVNRQKSLCASKVMTLPRIAPEEVIHLGIAAIESLAVMGLGDCLFVPRREFHASGFGIAAIAARSLALGAGGNSRRLSTRRLSRSDSVTTSAAAITVSASRSAV